MVETKLIPTFRTKETIGIKFVLLYGNHKNKMNDELVDMAYLHIILGCCIVVPGVQW